MTTRSGLGVNHTARRGNHFLRLISGHRPSTSNVAYGGEKWGNFISVGGLNTGRFLDPPEFAVLHDKGNEENFFDRLDFKLSDKDTIQLNLEFTRSWFQTPNTWDQQLQTCTVLSADCATPRIPPGPSNPITGNPLGPDRSALANQNL